jgi:uncharacterized protein (TIRG00374 family)
MVEQRRFALNTVIILSVAGLFVFLLYLCFFVPFHDLVQTLEHVNPFYFLLASSALFISAAFYSLTWQRLLHMLSVKASFLKAFQFVWVENFVNLTIPAEPIGGDVSRIYLMTKWSGENAGKVTASVLGHRILVTSVTIGSLIISAVYFVIRYRPPSLVLEFVAIVAAAGVIYVSLLFYLSIRKEVTEKIVNWLITLLTRLSRGRWQLEHLKSSAIKSLSAFRTGILTLGERPKNLILPVIFSIFALLLDILIAVLVFTSLGSLGTTISLSAIVIVYSISVAIQYIPIGIIPGEVGLTEIVMTSLFTLLGNPNAIAVFAVATVLIRLLTFWARLFVGGLVVQFMGIKSLLPSQSSIIRGEALRSSSH